MENSRFDSLARIVGANSSRRAFAQIVGGLVIGGVATGAGLRSSEAAKSGKCKPSCPACQVCQNGKCKRKHGKKKCKAGTCLPVSNGSACNGTGQCLNGSCNAKPTCLGTGQDCTAGTASSCCSGVCRGDNHCQNSQVGQPCLQTSDCITPSQCVGFVCQAA